MKVLYFIFEGFDTTNGTNHLALTTMHTFLDNGIDVYLMTSHSKGLYPDIPDSIKNRKGFTYSVIQRSKVGQRNFIQRYKDGMQYAYNASREWGRHKDGIDAVVLQSTPTAFFSAFLLHRRLKKPVIFNSFDIFPDGPYLFGAINNKAAYAILALMQGYVYRTSSKIVVISEDMKQSLIRKHVREPKLAVIPNWYDSGAVKEVSAPGNGFIRKYNIDRGKFIVQYAGNFGYTFNYQAVIEVARLLKDEDDIEFHMVGAGGFGEDFKREARENGLHNVRFFPWQDAGMVSDVYSACDIGFVPLSKGVVWTSFPSKCALLMACSRTFICMCEKNSDFYRFVNGGRVGICVARTDYQRAADMIRRLSADRKRLRKLGQNARMCGEKYYSSEVNAHKYVDVFKELVEGEQ